MPAQAMTAAGTNLGHQHPRVVAATRELDEALTLLDRQLGELIASV